MEAKVYIERDFFKVFDDFKANPNPFEIDIKTENKNKLLRIFNEVTLNLSGNEIEPLKIIKKLHKITSEGNKPSTYEEYILLKAYRNGNIMFNGINFDSTNSLFFLDKSNEEIKTLTEEKNINCIGTEYNFEKKIIPATFAHKPCDINMKGLGLELLKHKCRNIILIEPYIFKDSETAKRANLCTLIKELFQNTKEKCYLSIITKQNEGGKDKLYKKIISEIKESLNLYDLELSVFIPEKDKFNSNRHLITDYSISDLQHLFDRDNATISCEFLYNNDILKNFEIINNLFKRIKDEIKNNGTNAIRYGNILENPLLKNLE